MAISTLVVGVGGTGTLVVRALKKRYEETRSDERVPANFLALDFDRSALQTGDNGQEFAALPDEDFLYLNPTAIQELLRNIDRTQDGQLAWEKVRRWFPDPERVRIPTSEVEANGASQLRPLGRLGFFLNDELLEATVRRKLGGLQAEVDTMRLSTSKRVIVVSSLAGGTGGGMLLDLAYLLRRQDSRPRVFLYLLLPEVFVDLDSGGRVFPNSYGLLKELAHLKEQQIPFNGDYLRIAPIHVAVAREEPFARLFLFSGAANGGAESIQDICVRMAEAVLGQLHRTIQEKTLAVVSNTVAGSSDEEHRRRRTHCFSAAGSTFLTLKSYSIDAETLVRYVAAEVLTATEADLERDSEARQLLNGLATRVADAFDGLTPGAGDPAATGQSAAPGGQETIAEPQSERSPIHDKMDRIGKRWKQYIDGQAAANARAIVNDLSGTLDRTRLRLRAAVGEASPPSEPAAVDEHELTSPAPKQEQERANTALSSRDARDGQRAIDQLAAAQAEIESLAQLVLASFNEENYASNLKALKHVAPSFVRYDLLVRKAVSTFFPTLDATLELRTRQARRQFLRSLERLDRRFWVSFSDATNQQDADLQRQWSEQRAHAHSGAATGWRFSRYANARDRAVNTALLDIDLLQRGLSQATLTTHIAEILKVRAYKEWKRGLEAAKEAAEQAWKHVKQPFDDLPPSEKRADRIESLPADLQAAIRQAVIDKLPAIVEGAQRYATLEPLARKQRLTALLERVRTDVPVLRNVQVEIDGDFQKKVHEALVRARQAVFERRTPNPQRKGFTFILVPNGLFGTDERKPLKAFLQSASVQILDSRCEIAHYDGTRIWIYYEDLFNPPEHLKNLDEYYRVYTQQPYKELFHADRRFLDHSAFVDIHSATSHTIVTCGNDACNHNLAGVPRSESICPRCERMIKSRCGNADCTLDNLQAEAERDAHLCPRCHGFNHAAWWLCQRHGKLDHEIPIDKLRCPRCIELHLADPIGYPEDCISTRPDIARRIECPRCLDLQRRDPDYKVFRIPQALTEFYRNGVNGHMLGPFCKLARDQGLIDCVRCPHCRTLLIPLHHARLEQKACPRCIDRSQPCDCQPAEPAPTPGAC
jgi:hypothetical protein